MKNKESYLHPEQIIISLEMIRETMQAYSSTGQNFEAPVTGGSWEDLFNDD